MPKCKNCQEKGIKLHKTYNGNEPSPKGRGVCAGCAEEGDVAEGTDGQLWEALRQGSSLAWKVISSPTQPPVVRATSRESLPPTKKRKSSKSDDDAGASKAKPSSIRPTSIEELRAKRMEFFTKKKKPAEVIVIDDSDDSVSGSKTKRKPQSKQKDVIVIDDSDDDESGAPKPKRKSQSQSKPDKLDSVFGGVMLAKEFDNQDVRGWFLSEKYDGYRAVWDGRRMLSRNGNEFVIPDFFRRMLPKETSLDGELWFGRGKFQNCGVFKKKVPKDSEWKDVKYMVFDTPLSKNPFEERYAVLRSLNIWNETIKLVEQVRVQGRDDIDRHFKRIVEGGGEGVMLRKPDSLYINGRSEHLLKMKEIMDSECEVIGYKMSETGPGILGSFDCRDVKTNQEFNLSGMTHEIRRNFKTTHPFGTLITYKYRGLTKDRKPRQPTYLRIRLEE
jgi:DNA ligase-1